MTVTINDIDEKESENTLTEEPVVIRKIDTCNPKVEAALLQVTPLAKPPRFARLFASAAIACLFSRSFQPSQDVTEIRKEKNLSSPNRVGGNIFGARLE